MLHSLKSRFLSAALAIAGAAVSYAASPSLTVHQLGTDNTLVRIAGSDSLLIFPVQESMPDAEVQVLVDGRLQTTLYVRLADSNVDYCVPFDLTPYLGKGDVMLNIIAEVDRTHSREASEFICWDEMTTANSFPVENTEKYRPAFHHTPLFGWMNDPNGMVCKDGVWHLYYQRNPYGSKWQNMTWGHSSSTDLVHWQHHPDAIRPDGLGSIFSGSATLDPANTAGFGADAIVAMYTSCGRNQVQSLAYSLDNGLSFTPFPGNPVIANRREARDPNMFWHEPTKSWVLVLADALEQQMVIYTSPNLRDWTRQSTFGKGYGSQFGVWECPDLFELPVAGSSKSKWVLVCNINPGGPFGGSATQYFVGDFDGRRFTTSSPAHVAKWMDYGKDHYATVSWSNAPGGRRTVIGWMSNWQYANDVPTMQFRSANTLPRDLGLFRAADGEYYLSVVPAPELLALRSDPVVHAPFSVSRSPESFPLPADNDGICEIVVDYAAKGCRQLDFALSNENGDSVTMTLDLEKAQFSMDRSRSGLVKFSRHFPAVTIAPTLAPKGAKGSLRIFIDRCSIEVFDSEGRFAMTNLVFPSAPYSSFSVSAPDGRARISSLSVYPLNPAI